MLLIFGECGRDATLAAETYAARFKVVYKSIVTHDINQARVINLVKNNPHIGSRDTGSRTGISKSSVLRILKKHEYHPYIWNFTKNCMVKILQIE
jgi:hypothetical protein